MKNKTIIGICIGIVLLITVILFCTVIIEKNRNRTKEYNDAVRAYNQMVDYYNLYASGVCLDNIDGIPCSVLPIECVSEKTDDIIRNIFRGNDSKKIQKDIETIRRIVDELEIDIEIIKRITASDESWVKECLDNIDEIGGYQSVTRNNDPNGMLGKEGGYISCVYFLVNGLELEKYQGVSVVDKGTDAGGAIEIYSNIKDAMERCEYLSEYDNTLLYSGSYAVVGTMVIRLSYALTDEEQLYLTDRITMELTKN